MVQNFALAAVLVMFAAVPTLAGAEKGADHKGGTTTTTTTATEASATAPAGGEAGNAAKAGSADDKAVAAET
ncbi:MAG: hypothetical protein K2Y18_09195, partial [Alphaproteobacteria bacterium]|nr:hypothetical protein [Alphaproteobacteria bacterium]